MVAIASIGFAVGTCRFTDALKPAGAKNVALAYGGDSTLVQGVVVAAPAVATVDGEPYARARFVFTSSDTTVVAVRGDSLEAVKRGTATLTVTLTSAILPQSPPAITRTLRVVAGSLVLDSAQVTFRNLGDTVTLHATPLDANGHAIAGAASWRSSDTTVVAVSAAGHLLAIKNGAATLRAIVDFDTAAIPVTVRQTLANFTFDQPSLVIDAIGATTTVTLTARDARGNAMAGVSPAWSSGDTTIATVTASGTATGVRVGSTFLYARQGAVTDSLPITVTQRATRLVIIPKPVPDITAINNQRQLGAVAYDHNNVVIPNPPITWSVSNPTILSVSPQGLVTGLAVGTAKVAAALGAGVDSVAVNVTNAPASVRVAPHAASSTATGDTLLFTAAAFNTRGDTVGGITFSWHSPDTTIVQVTSDGHAILKGVGTARVIAGVGLLADTATVTATNVIATLHFTLPSGVTVGPVQRILTAIGDTESPPVVITNARGATLPRGSVTWSSDDPTVVRVTALGLVTARDTGRTLVRMTGSGLTDSAAYTVTQLATRLVISPKPVPDITAINNQRQLGAVAYDHNNVVILNPPITWSVSNPTILSVSPQGLVTGLAVGTAKVGAALGAGVDSVAVNVTNALASVRVAPHTASSLATGDTLLFTAAAFNSRGDTVGGITFSWHSPDTTIVQVTSDGHAILKGVGTARVIAGVGLLADTATVTATNLPATVRFVLPDSITVGPVTRMLTAIGDTESPPVVITNARGATLPRGSVTWSSDDPTVVRVTALGLVTARDTGQTLVRMTSGALADSAIYVASNLPASMVVGGLPADTLTALGQSLAYPTQVLNRRGVLIAGYPVAWRSTNRLVVDTVLHDTVTARGFGTTLLIATAGSVVDTFTLVVKHLTRWTVDNSSIVSPRVGTAFRPYVRIQDAVNAAGANDTVIVKVGAGAYSETVALSRRLTLLGDSGSFVAAGRDPATLPLISHDSGAAGITAYTTAPMTIRYFTLRHSLDGPAIDGDGSDLTIEYFYVNPPGSVSSRIGRGISVTNSAFGTRIMRSQVNSVRGYGIRLENANGAVVSGVGVQGVDSLAGLEEGAGIKVVASSADSIRANVLRRTQIGVLVSGASGVRVDSNDASTNRVGMRLDGGAVAGAVLNDIFDNDSAGVVNPQGTQLFIPGNWWGDSLGPRNEGPPAVGDSAAGNIFYTAVLTNPVSGLDLVPAALRLVDGNNQSASAKTQLAVPLAVRVVGPNGLPVAGVGVTFVITAGGGQLAGVGPGMPLTVTTDGSGLAKAAFKLPNVVGFSIITVTGATVSIGSVTFTETAT